MRLKSEIWVKAYIRRCFAEGYPSVVVRRGDSDAGTIYLKVNHLNGEVTVFGPAPIGFSDEPQDRNWIKMISDTPVGETDADEYLNRQIRSDPDIWIVEIESRDGTHFLENLIVQSP